jgi:hypothetical protein
MESDGWKITIHGGFAFVFEGDDASGRAAQVTVGPYRKPEGHPRYHPHEMVLRVPEDALNRTRTTLPYQTVAGYHLFVLRDDVKLNDEATGDLVRTISPTRPAGWNDFYWVYDADRFKDRTGKYRTPLGNWQNRLLAQLELRGGELTVLPPRFAGIFEISDGVDTFEQPLATHIEYHPRWKTPAEVEFRTRQGIVVTRPADFDIAAECGCGHEPPVGPIAGFDLTFDLYRDPKSAPQFKPRFKGFTPPPAATEPGPDCPPRSYCI